MSFHPGQTFTYGETPSATKWQYLWDNDYALADGSGIEAGAINNSHLAANIVDSSKVDWNASTGKIWWDELGRTVLGANGDTIAVTSFTAKKYLRLIIHQAPTGTVSTLLRFNNDSGTNYAQRIQTNGAADTTTVSASQITLAGAVATRQFTCFIDILNIQAQEKVGYSFRVDQNAAGAATAPQREEMAFKWVNTSNQITRVDVINGSTGDFLAGSGLIVLGHD